MKPKVIVIYSLVVLAGLYCVLIGLARERRKRERAELHMLDMIKGNLSSHLTVPEQVREPWPTNWSSLSNSVNWKLVTEICDRYSLPPVTELYTLLPQPVYYNTYRQTGAIFLVRSKPSNWAGGESGRWILMVGRSTYSGHGWPTPTNDDVFRQWFPDKYLPPQISSQLTSPVTR